jgi:hypothetical protein
MWHDIMATIKTARIVGWREWRKTTMYLYRNPAAQEAGDYCEFRVGNLRKEYNTACRALGLPDDWKYNEAELRRARCSDPVERYYAIDTLVRYGNDRGMMEWLEGEKRQESSRDAAE